MEYKLIAGVLTAIIVASTGTFYLIEDDGFKNCVGNWEFNESTGMHDCESRNLSEWCFKLSGENPLEGYRCYLGKVVDPPQSQCEIPQCEITGNNKYWTCYSSGGYETLLGELD